MSRFDVGDVVRLNGVVDSPYKGKIGVILQVDENPRALQTLDEYIIEFPDGKKTKCWAVQLERRAKCSVPGKSKVTAA